MVVHVPDETQVVVSRVFAAGILIDVDCDVPAEQQGSGLKTRGWGGCRGAIAQPRSECHHLQGAGGSFKGGGKFIVILSTTLAVLMGAMWTSAAVTWCVW